MYGSLQKEQSVRNLGEDSGLHHIQQQVFWQRDTECCYNENTNRALSRSRILRSHMEKNMYIFEVQGHVLLDSQTHFPRGVCLEFWQIECYFSQILHCPLTTPQRKAAAGNLFIAGCGLAVSKSPPVHQHSLYMVPGTCTDEKTQGKKMMVVIERGSAGFSRVSVTSFMH